MCCRESPGTRTYLPTLWLRLLDQRFEVAVKSVVTAEHGKRLATRARRGTPLIVADRIAADAKLSLQQAGINYFDRRGELRLVAPPLIVHTSVKSAFPMASSPGGSLDSQVAKEVAISWPADTQPAPRRPSDRPLHRPSPQRRLQRHGRSARRRSAHLRW